MCMQCAVGAAAVVGGASGFRAWVAGQSRAWMTPGRLRALTGSLVVVSVLVAGLIGG